MEEYARHKLIWRLLALPVTCLTHIKFKLQAEPVRVDGPMLLIPNHACAWDPLLTAMCVRHKQTYFVASEHLFRLGWISRLIQRALAPIPRRKASSGADTVKACLRHLRAGHSVCLYAEGEQCWCGQSQKVFPATGKLAKSSGATLVTLKIEGNYLSCPRWGKGVRRGRVRCYPVGIYPPEVLSGMNPKEINALIERDIAEDAWQRQREDPAVYRGRRLAEGLEKALYLCPSCKRIGGLHTRGDRLFCDCGLSVRYTETGFFSPDTPFADLAEWDAWQREELHRRSFPHGDMLFGDEELQLVRLIPGHGEETLGNGALEQYEDRLVCAGHSFPLDEISDMAAVLTSRLLLTHEGNYYEIRTDKSVNIRKYLDIWRQWQGR